MARATVAEMMTRKRADLKNCIKVNVGWKLELILGVKAKGFIYWPA